MKNIHLSILVRLTAVTAPIFLIHYLLVPMITQDTSDFRFFEPALLSFILYVLICASLHGITSDVFRRSTWTTGPNPVKIGFTVLFFLHATAEVFVSLYSVVTSASFDRVLIGYLSNPHLLNLFSWCSATAYSAYSSHLQK